MLPKYLHVKGIKPQLRVMGVKGSGRIKIKGYAKINTERRKTNERHDSEKKKMKSKRSCKIVIVNIYARIYQSEMPACRS
jgi:hypothetical protein